MIRRFTAWLLVCLLATVAICHAEETAATDTARYTAITIKSVQPREGMGKGRKYRKIRTDAKVEVLEYGERWCLVHYKDRTGYVRTKDLWGFVSLDPLHWPSPQFTPCKGYVTLAAETNIKGGKFGGLDAAAGAMIAVYDDTLRLPVWRGSAVLPEGAGEYKAFADWQAAEPGDVIAGFTTYYNDRTGTPLQKPRQHNIALGCERIDGQVVEPGKEFSFNALCAPYKQSNGYQVAKNISHDGKGPGGGVCQVSTTLYNALLALPVQITSWSAHRPSGVQYIPRSFDSAVGSTTDMSFRNDLPYPVSIRAVTQGGALTVMILRAAD